jgi:hypothetical protein
LESIFLLFIALGIYFFPSFEAFRREHRSASAILVLNIFLGWTFVGWVAALVWAFKRPEIVIQNKEDKGSIHELERLVALRDKGAISEHEFSSEKQKILNRS